MPKVLCTLPNASEEINGVKFTSHAKGMVSENVADDVAAAFAEVPGYEIVGESKKTDADEAAARAALAEKAEALGVAVKPAWGAAKIEAAIEAAEKAALAAAVGADK